MLILDVIFVAFSTVLSIALDSHDTPQKAKDPKDSTVRVAVALNGGNGATQADGTFPAIIAYNEIGDYIGTSYWTVRPHIKSGAYNDETIYQDKGPRQQATYLQLFAGTDAICIAYISQTWADGQIRGWMGDMGRACGKPFYYSNIFVGENGHVPDCTWMDADHSNPLGYDKPEAIQIHMQDYTNLTADFTKDPAHYCAEKSIIFVRDLDTEPAFDGVDFKKQGPPKSASLFLGSKGRYQPIPRRRQQPEPQARSAALANMLVSSPRSAHSAIDLCGNAMSYGPDFVSHSERVFCDMGTKTLWPLCGSEILNMKECYRWETHSLVTGGEHVAKNYGKVEEWE